ncbi:MAG: asparagine synthase-related protein, partial [Endomicrobiia bacterium]
ISKLSSEKLYVALTGIGGDEIFCGYPRYQGMKLSKILFWLKIPRNIIDILPESYSASNLYGRIKRFLYGLSLDENWRYISYISYLQNKD